MLSKFSFISHFVHIYFFFFGHKMLLTFISIVTHINLVKKNHNKAENLNTCKIFNKGSN